MNAKPTATELRDQAAAHEEEAAASFDRCDTDGFVSQWANGLTATKLRRQAELAENGGMIEVAALFNLDGEIASVHRQWGQWGPYWVLNDAAAAAYGKRFFSESQAKKAATRERNMRAKGYTIGTVKVRGYATITGGGTGLGGAASCYVAVLPIVDDLRDGRFEIVATTGGDPD